MGTFKHASSVGTMTLISRVLGMLRDTAIAGILGAQSSADAFFVAFRIPNMLRRFVAEGSMATAFVPIFTEELESGEQKAKKAYRETLGFSIIVTTVLTVFGVLFAEQLTLLFAPGFSSSSGKLQLATELTQIMFFFLITTSLLAVSSSALNALGFFAIPASSTAILNICMIAFTALSLLSDRPSHIIAIGVVVGGVVSLLPSVFKLQKLGYSAKPLSPLKSNSVKRLSKLMIPAILSSSVYQIMVFFNTFLASTLEEGSVSWLYYADRLFQFPLGVFSLAVATAILPSLSKHAAQNNIKALNSDLSEAIAWVSFISLPASLGLISLAYPITDLVYHHGSFTEYDVEQSSKILVAFSFGLYGIGVQSIVVRAFLAKKNTLLPSIISTICLLLDGFFSCALMGKPQVSLDTTIGMVVFQLQSKFEIANLGATGLAWGTTIGTSISLILLLVLLPMINVNLNYKNVISRVVKSLFASIIMWKIVSYSINFASAKLANNSSILVFVGLVVGIASYFLITLSLRSEESIRIYAELKKKFNF